MSTLDIEGGSALLIEGDYVLLLESDTITGRVFAPSPLGAPSLLSANNFGHVAAPGPLGNPALYIGYSCLISVPSPLGAPALDAFTDFTPAVPDYAQIGYTVDLVTPGGKVRVPISSWQATLNTESSNYVQCVIPSVSPWLDAINAATDFIIYRTAQWPGSSIEHIMAETAITGSQISRGHTNYTCTLRGYSEGFAEDLDPPVKYDRTLEGVRSIAVDSSGQRVRCGIDWLLRPGHRAYADGSPLIAAYINYYVNDTDGYMDVGERA